MPFRSKKQTRYMFAVHPEIARRWADETHNIKKLPLRVKKKKLSEGIFSGLAESLTRFKTLAKASPYQRKLRVFIKTRQYNFQRKGLSAQGRGLQSTLRNR